MATNPVYAEKDMEEPWTINDEYKYAPKREGDPWQRLLDPILKKEKIRCDGWKDEVGNLLIFAGLFSAVVTAFIIESYKTLQPDPSMDIVGLLSQISGQLNGPGNRTTEIVFNSTNLPSQFFTPTHSATRVNVFWFLSLIFSLTTVLVGIVALQWLREFQAYPGQSAREILALYHMRAESMRKWHVWKIFTALPLLLQIALVLFFVGVIEFLDAIGSKAVAISATVAIAFALLFLVLTTIFPAAHVIALRLLFMFPIQLTQLPSQCPYKSPQSKLFYALLKASSFLWHSLGYSQRQRIERLFAMPFAKLITSKYIPVHRRLPSLSVTRTWIDYDLGWLWVRDACHSVFNEEISSMNPTPAGVSTEYEPKIALYDVMSILKTNQSNSDLYHCVSDISRLHTISNLRETHYVGDEIHILWRRNNYFRSFLPFSVRGDNEMIDKLRPDTENWDMHLPPGFYFTTDTAPVSDSIKVLHELNIYNFVAYRWEEFNEHERVSPHIAEIRLRIQNYLFGRKVTYSQQVLPSYLRFFTPIYYKNPTIRATFSFQNIVVYNGLFQFIFRQRTSISTEDLHGHRSILKIMAKLGRFLSSEITNHVSGDSNILRAIDGFLDGLCVNLSMIADTEIPHSNLVRAMLYAAVLLQPVREALEENHVSNAHADALHKILVSFFWPYLEEPTEMADVERRALIAANIDALYEPPEKLRGLLDIKKQTLEGVGEDCHTQNSQSCLIVPSPDLGRSFSRHDLTPPKSSPILQSEGSNNITFKSDGISPSNECRISHPESHSSSDPDVNLDPQEGVAAVVDDLSSSNHSRPVSVHYGSAQSNGNLGDAVEQTMDESQMNPDAHQLA